MTLTTSLATANAVPESAPLKLPADLCLSPEQFALVCAENRDSVLSSDASLVLEAS